MKQSTVRRRSFEVQALPHLEALYRTALYMVNESDAQDLVLESFVEAYRSGHNCQFCPNHRTRLFRIMVHILDDKYRSASIRDAEMVNEYTSHCRNMNRQATDEYEQVPFSTLSSERVRNVIKNLPDDLRLPVLLSILDGFSYQEIADITDINLQTVKSGLRYGRKLMQSELSDHAVYRDISSMTADRVRSRGTG